MNKIPIVSRFFFNVVIFNVEYEHIDKEWVHTRKKKKKAQSQDSLKIRSDHGHPSKSHLNQWKHQRKGKNTLTSAGWSLVHRLVSPQCSGVLSLSHLLKKKNPFSPVSEPRLAKASQCHGRSQKKASWRLPAMPAGAKNSSQSKKRRDGLPIGDGWPAIGLFVKNLSRQKKNC